MGPKPGLERRVFSLDGNPGYLAENDFDVRIPRQDLLGFDFARALIVARTNTTASVARQGTRQIDF